MLPIVMPSGAGLDGFLAGSFFPMLPPVGSLPDGDAAADDWRELSYRLIRENAALRARLITLGEPARLVPFDESYWERQPLRVEAVVLGRDVSPWRGSLVVSAGSREGIKPGFPVLMGEALVGTVAEVGRLASRVRLLGDPGQRIWAEVVSGEETGEGFVAGTGAETLDMHLLRAGIGKKGDPVFTAGGDALIPRGLLVGAVKKISDLDRNGVSEVEIEPAVPPSKLRFVNILVVKDHLR